MGIDSMVGGGFFSVLGLAIAALAGSHLKIIQCTATKLQLKC